jgi:hypothetical protein
LDFFVYVELELPPILIKLQSKRFLNYCFKVINFFKGLDISTSPNQTLMFHKVLKLKTTKEERVRVRSLARSTLGVERHVGALGWGLGLMTNE